MNAQTAIIEILSAMTTASSLFIIAAGLTLVFGALRIINLAHGSFYMIGALLMATLLGTSHHALFWPALLLAPVAVAALGTLCEVVLLRRIYHRDHLVQLLATYALFLIFSDLSLRLWGTDSRTVAAPAMLTGNILLRGASFPIYDLFVIVVAAGVGIALWLLLQWTMLGWQIRAAVEDPESLAAIGTNVPLLFTLVFTLGAFLSGLGGAVVAPLQAVGPGMDQSVIVSAFIVTVIGGLGSIVGAALGAVVIGLLQAMGILWLPTWAPAFIFLGMILVLVIRPAGLLGTVGSAYFGQND
jgi:branched-subunit amino acid ABC-type transport system permease component